MEVSGVVFRHVPYFSGSGIDKHSSKSSFPVTTNFDAGNRFSDRNRVFFSKPRKFSRVSSSGFCDNGHLQFYASPRCGEKKENQKAVTTKKKLKLLKGLSKDLSLFSELGFGVDPETGLVGEIQGKMISEAAEVLLKRLQQVRAEQKELKKKKKQEKAKLKAVRIKTKQDESSSSESSDSECGEVIDMSRLRNEACVQEQPILDELQSVPQVAAAAATLTPLTNEECSPPDTSSSSVPEPPMKRVEVCMGGKCKKSGGAALMAEFERVLGIENSVVGCKCMGKCRDGPNVRVMNCAEGIQAEGNDDSVRTPVNPLCIGVGLADVGVIVANFFGENASLIPAM